MSPCDASQATLSKLEADNAREANDKAAALRRVAELEALNAELTKLEAEANELGRQLEAERAVQQAKQHEISNLLAKVEVLEANNSSLSSTCSSTEERAAHLEVGAANCIGHVLM